MVHVQSSPDMATAVADRPQADGRLHGSAIGSGVWIEYEQGDPYPIWTGCFSGSLPRYRARPRREPGQSSIVIQGDLAERITISGPAGPTAES